MKEEKKGGGILVFSVLFEKFINGYWQRGYDTTLACECISTAAAGPVDLLIDRSIP